MNIATILVIFYLVFLDGTYGEEVEGILKHRQHSHNNRLHHYANPKSVGDETGEKHHLHHHSRHHKAFKSRNGPTCTEICDPELVTVAKWLNNTNELKLLYQLIPPSVKQAISGATTMTPSMNSSSLLNGLNLNELYDSTAEWPILTYLSKIVGFCLSRVRGIIELFQMFPRFANMWNVILHGISGGSNNSDVLINNLKSLLGSNESFGKNLFNFTHWENLLSPSSFIKGIEHAFENGFDSLTNTSTTVKTS